jgi:hypothetical protein
VTRNRTIRAVLQGSFIGVLLFTVVMLFTSRPVHPAKSQQTTLAEFASEVGHLDWTGVVINCLPVGPVEGAWKVEVAFDKEVAPKTMIRYLKCFAGRQMKIGDRVRIVEMYDQGANELPPDRSLFAVPEQGGVVK